MPTQTYPAAQPNAVAQPTVQAQQPKDYGIFDILTGRTPWNVWQHLGWQGGGPQAVQKPSPWPDVPAFNPQELDEFSQSSFMSPETIQGMQSGFSEYPELQFGFRAALEDFDRHSRADISLPADPCRDGSTQ